MSIMKLKTNSKLKSHGTHKRKYRPFPYVTIARMWSAGKTIAAIARAIGRVDKNNPKDPYHSLRNCLYRMHTFGYRNRTGHLVRLPHRVSAKTVRAARKAGLRAWK